MQQKANLLIFLIPFLIFSCDSDDLSELKKKRTELSTEIAEKTTELDKVNESIAKLQKSEVIQTITPYTISAQPFQHSITLQSNISTEQDVMIYPEFPGSLTWHVREGQRVGRGQVIGSISDGGMSSQLKQAEIQADLAKAAYEKQSRLWKQNIGSEIQFLQAKTSYEAALKSISAIKSQLGKTKIRAPFSGTIDNLIMQSGQVVSPGVPIAKIVNLHNMKVTADVSEKYIRDVKRGTLAKIEIETLDQTIQGRVSRVSNSINPSNRTFSIEIPVSNRSGLVKPNMSAKIDLIDYNNSNAILVPNASIKENAKGLKYVYTISNINGKNGLAKKTPIQIGKSNSDFTEVLLGLREGEKVVHEGINSVIDGAKLRF